MTDTLASNHQPNADEYYSVPIPETNYWRKTPVTEAMKSPSPRIKDATPIPLQSITKAKELKATKTKLPELKLRRQDSKILTKSNSQQSIKIRKRPKPQVFSKSGEATFEEITRLVNLNDEQKAQISKLLQEVKTLKIINARQEKGLQMMDKEQGEYPRLFKAMTEELRIAKAEKHKATERVGVLERMSITQSEEFHKLQSKYKELKSKLKQLEAADVGQLRQENVKMELELQKKDLAIEELTEKLRIMTAERDREIHFTKSKTAKIMKELELAKQEHGRLSSLLHVFHTNKERERVVNSLSIYSRNSMHESGDESSAVSLSSPKRVKKTLQKQLSKITDHEEPEDLPVVTVSLAKVEQKPTVYKPVLTTTQKLSSPTPQHSKAPSTKSTPFPGQRAPSRLSSKMTSPVPMIHPNPPASVYSDDFE